MTANKELVHCFITMAADGDMKMRDWALHIEELRAEVAATVAAKDWGQLQMYGPDNDGFGLPAVCVQARMDPDAYRALLESVADSPWISLPVTFQVIQQDATLTLFYGVTQS